MRLLLPAILALACTLARGQELITLETRPGATQSYLLLAPKGAPPQAAALLFPGGTGSIRLRLEGSIIRFGSNNFLVRSRQLFVRAGVAAAVIDAPSDRAEGMTNAFRKSDAHAHDVAAVVADLGRRYPGLPVFLVGTSMGTVSAAYAGRALGADAAGVVLTSTPFRPSGRRSAHGDSNLSDFDLDDIKAALLIVHHAADACGICPYDEARRRAGDRALVTVSGGDPPRSGPCEALSAHGYLGKEEETVGAIVRWMLKKPAQGEIK